MYLSANNSQDWTHMVFVSCSSFQMNSTTQTEGGETPPEATWLAEANVQRTVALVAVVQTIAQNYTYIRRNSSYTNKDGGD